MGNTTFSLFIWWELKSAAVLTIHTKNTFSPSILHFIQKSNWFAEAQQLQFLKKQDKNTHTLFSCTYSAPGSWGQDKSCTQSHFCEMWCLQRVTLAFSTQMTICSLGWLKNKEEQKGKSHGFGRIDKTGQKRNRKYRLLHF